MRASRGRALPASGGSVDREPGSWHEGLVARYWAEFVHDGPEVAYYRSVIERCGQPALDVGCGAGRMLLPYLRAGLDVDGVDVSQDMLDRCRERAAADGLTPDLRSQALHELDLPRRYRTIYACGVFGLGSTRAQDAVALERLHHHLEPGGTLVLDHEVAYGGRHWPLWTTTGRAAHDPTVWSEPDRHRAADGSEFVLRGRLVDADPLEQVTTHELLVERWVNGELVEAEQRTLTQNLYFAHELRLLLDRAGFVDIEVHGDWTDEPAHRDHGTLVVSARMTGQ